MKKYIQHSYQINRKIKTIILLFLLCSLLLSQNIIESWNILQKDSVVIKYKQEKFPICEANMLIHANIQDVLLVVEDLVNYKVFFDSIIISDINDKDEVRLAINMPFPFSDRDYTVKFSKNYVKINNDDKNVNFLYESVISNSYPLDSKYIRLVNAQGGWFINYVDSNYTNIKYQWNGEMLGNFPELAYTKAWIQQGNEIMLNLNDEVQRRKLK